jgi:hypothetical protein
MTSQSMVEISSTTTLTVHEVVRSLSVAKAVSVLDANQAIVGIDLLIEASEPDAAHDSSARYMPPRCHPGTREQHIEDLVNWASPSPLASTPAPLIWMKGHAGVGKSAIAQTCVEKLQELRVCFAAFFFSVFLRDRPERLFSTIAYQLCLHFSDYRELLNVTILHDKTIFRKSLRAQYMNLIFYPLQRLAMEGKGIARRLPIFIDGLDECCDSNAQFEIVQIVANTVTLQCAPPLCWAFFSRPEPRIEAAFAVPLVRRFTHVDPLPISRSTKTEMKLYLRTSFKAILQRRNIPSETRWPSEPDLMRLVKAADGLFNYGATALRFIEGYPCLTLDEPLQLVLDHATNPTNSSPSPFADMDALYMLILRRIPYQVLPRISIFLTFLSSWYSWLWCRIDSKLLKDDSPRADSDLRLPQLCAAVARPINPFRIPRQFRRRLLSFICFPGSYVKFHAP